MRTRGLGGGKAPKLSPLDQALAQFGTVIKKGVEANTDDEIEVEDGVFFTTVDHQQFAEFRKSLGISDADYLKSMSKLSGGKTEASGKSGSLFWFSEDHRYVLKSVAQGELDALVDMLPRYIDHFKTAKANTRPCLLCRFFGAYLVRYNGNTIRLIAMNNLMGTGKPQRAYDLKGTTEDRFVDEEKGGVMKDLNYKDCSVVLEAPLASSLHEAVEADSDFLRQEDIMDYSLLLGVFDTKEVQDPVKPVYLGTELVSDEDEGEEEQPAAFRMGIIDILVRWTTKKKLAHVVKKPTLGFCCREEIDTEPPDYYQDRFSSAMTEKIVSN